MKLQYQTAVATLVQFIVLSLLNIANGLNSIVSTCTRQGGDCLTNTLTSVLFFLLIVAFFGFIWVLGYSAQDRRSKRLAQVLIMFESLVCLVALFNAHHHTDVLSLITSILDLGLAVWVIILAFRLMRAKGGRIMAKPRTRQRRHANSKIEL